MIHSPKVTANWKRSFWGEHGHSKRGATLSHSNEGHLRWCLGSLHSPEGQPTQHPAKSRTHSDRPTSGDNAFQTHNVAVVKLPQGEGLSQEAEPL